MKDAFILLLSVLTFILGFALCVDNAANPSLKAAFRAYLNRPFRGDDSTEDSYHLAVRSFEAVLGSRFLSLTFFFRSLLVSIAFISIFSLYKSRWDAEYLGLIRSALLSPSSILGCVVIVLVGTLMSDWMCFGKSLFFAQLFNVRRRVFPIVVLAAADLCLTVFIFTVVVGLAIAAAALDFDMVANKHVLFDEIATLDPGLFANIHEDTSPSGQGNPQKPPEFSVEYNADVVTINWRFFPTPETLGWVRHIAHLRAEEPVPLELVVSMFQRRFSIGEIKQDSAAAYIENQLGQCYGEKYFSYSISNEAFASTDVRVDFEMTDTKEHGVLHAPVEMRFGKINAEVGKLLWADLSFQSFLDLWGRASQVLLSQYAFLIQSAGLRSSDGFPLRLMYDLTMEECKWKNGAQYALETLFSSMPVDGRHLERYSLPVGALPYVGLAATMFFHGMALFTFLGRLTLPVGRLLLPEVRFLNTGRFPFTVVALTGSLLTLSLFLVSWLCPILAFWVLELHVSGSV